MALFKEWSKPPKGKDIIDYLIKNRLQEYDIKIQDNGFMLIHEITDVEVSHSSQVVVISVSEE
jgi:hypothetical protein